MASASEFVEALRDIVGQAYAEGPGETLSEASEAFFGGWKGNAQAIVFPASVIEVRQIVELCRQAGKTIVPQCGNTGLVYGAQPNEDGDEIVVGFRRFKSIRDLDRLNRSVVVGAGVTIAELNDFLAEHNLQFPVSIGSNGSCQIGGVISTNAGGHSVFRYGMTRHQILGLEAVLADGRSFSNLKSLRKDNVGYDLAQMFCGAEGTLGLITAAAVKLVPLASHKAAALVAFDSLEAAVNCYGEISGQMAEFLSAFELMSDFGRDLVARHFPDHSFPSQLGRSPWYVLVEAEVAARGVDLELCLTEALAVIWEQGSVIDAVIAQNEEQRKQFWKSREALVFSQGKEGTILSHDVSVRISLIPDLVEAGQKTILDIHPEVKANIFGHVGDGNLHFNVIHSGGTSDFKREFGSKIEQALYQEVSKLGGSISAEHGVGKKKRDYVSLSRSPEEIGAMRDLRTAFDPGQLFAVGNIFRSPE